MKGEEVEETTRPWHVAVLDCLQMAGQELIRLNKSGQLAINKTGVALNH